MPMSSLLNGSAKQSNLIVKHCIDIYMYIYISSAKASVKAVVNSFKLIVRTPPFRIYSKKIIRVIKYVYFT